MKREYVIPSVEVFDFHFESWDQTPLKGILVQPKSKGKGPVILAFHGYTGFHGLPVDYLHWCQAGVTVVAFDLRGQGLSPDFANYSNGSRVPGWMLQGILDSDTYYYSNVYRDILLQLKWIKSDDFPVKVSHLGVMGSSQGGGLALAAAGLDDNIDFCLADWPFLAHFEKAIEIARAGPYLEISDYFKLNDPQYKTYPQVLQTLGYIDCVHFCENITCPTLMAIGLKDESTPPMTVFAAYNHLKTAEKKIEVYRQFTHEVNPFHEEEKLSFVIDQLSTYPSDDN